MVEFQCSIKVACWASAIERTFVMVRQHITQLRDLSVIPDIVEILKLHGLGHFVEFSIAQSRVSTQNGFDEFLRVHM